MVLDHRLGGAHFLERQEALFTAVAAALGAAKGQLYAATGAIAIDEELTGLDGLGHAGLAAAVFGPHRRQQAIGRAIGQGDGVGFVFEGEGRQHGAEDFFAGQLCVTRNGAKEGGGDPVAARADTGVDAAFGQHRNAGRFCRGDVSVNTGLLRGVHHGPTVEVHLGRAHAHLGIGGGHLLHHAVVHALLHQQPAAGGAGLPRVLHDGAHDDGHGAFDVGVFEDDLRRLAAQLQHALHRVFGGRLLHQGAHFVGAGEGNEVDARVARQRSAGFFAQAGDHVDGALGKAHLGSELGHAQGRQRGVFGGLEHHRIACRKGWRNRAAQHLRRVVPGNDVTRDAQGFAHQHHMVAVEEGDDLAV